MIPSIPKKELFNIFRIYTKLTDLEISAGVHFLSLRKGGILDIHYNPIVHIESLEEHIAIPINIFAMASPIRNAFKVSGVRLYHDGQEDPIGNILEYELQGKGNWIAREKSFSIDGEEGDIDFAIQWDDILFIFECKNPLLPAGSRELKGSWEYILKAADQLDLINRLISDSKNHDYFKRRLGVENLRFNKIVTGIVMSNRMMMGLRYQGHTISGLYDLCSFIASGEMTIVGNVVNLWNNPKEFTSEDLRRFFEDRVSYLPYFETMNEVSHTLKIGEKKIYMKTFQQNLERLFERYGFIESLEEYRKHEKVLI